MEGCGTHARWYSPNNAPAYRLRWIKIRTDQLRIIWHKLTLALVKVMVKTDLVFIDFDANTDSRRNSPVRAVSYRHCSDNHVIGHHVRRLLISLHDIRKCQQDVMTCRRRDPKFAVCVTAHLQTFQ